MADIARKTVNLANQNGVALLLLIDYFEECIWSTKMIANDAPIDISNNPGVAPQNLNEKGLTEKEKFCATQAEEKNINKNPNRSLFRTFFYMKTPSDCEYEVASLTANALN